LNFDETRSGDQYLIRFEGFSYDLVIEIVDPVFCEFKFLNGGGDNFHQWFTKQNEIFCGKSMVVYRKESSKNYFFRVIFPKVIKIKKFRFKAK